MATEDRVPIQLPGGPIWAYKEDGLLRARAIRYGTAERFQPPKAVQPWRERIDCTKKGPKCPQQGFRFDHVLGPVDSEVRDSSEDCLRVTVTAPGDASHSQKRAVIVWFHGGAYFFGAGDLDIFDPAELVRRGNVVVVNVTYRLGILGYQPVPGVVTANNGLLDQILALKWVKDNIAAFGGDAENVTIIGQSAGGDSVFCLSIADGTEGLFRRAVIVSAPFGLKKNRKPMNDALSKIAAGVITDKAVDLTIDQLLETQGEIRQRGQKYRQGGLPFAPWYGEFPMPNEDEAEERFYEASKRIDMLVGWTADDAMPFVRMVPAGVAVGKIPLIGYSIQKLVCALVTAVVWRWPALQLRKKTLAAGGHCASFCFEWFPKGNVLRAGHCIDMPFYIGSWDMWKQAPILNGPESEEVISRVGAEFKDLLIGFAKGDIEPVGHCRITEKGLLWEGGKPLQKKNV